MKFSSCHDVRQHLLFRQALSKGESIDKNDILVINDGFYGVKSQSAGSSGHLDKEYYFIDVQDGVCSCPMGRFGSFCKHQMGIYVHQKVAMPSLPAVTAKDRQDMAFLANGSAQDLEFYKTLDVSIELCIFDYFEV